MNNEVGKIATTREILILGHLNGKNWSKTQDKIRGQHGEDTVNDNGIRLINLCDQNKLKILNGFYQHGNIHNYTRTHKTQNLRSTID